MPSREETPSSAIEKPLGELFRQLSSDSVSLLRQEIALARAEIASGVGRAGRNAGGVALGLGVAGVGGLVLTAFAVALLGHQLGNYWLAALLVAVLLLAVAGVGGVLAIRKLRRPAGSGARSRTDGRDASTREPGVLALAKRTVREIGSDDITGQAAKVAYYGFMAMPPALMAIFALTGLFGSEQFAGWLMKEASTAMPGAVVDGILRPFIQQVVLTSAPGPLSIGLVLALWGASGVFSGLMVTLNVAYDVEENRGFVKTKAIAFGTMIAATALFLLAAVALLAGPELARLAGMGVAGEIAWTVLRWPLTFAFIVAAFWIVYYVLPNRDQKGCKVPLLKAAAVGAGLWVLASAGFRLYIANFSSYSKAYGFLGAFIILLLWLYVTGLAVLAGGELASEMEKGTNRGR